MKTHVNASIATVALLASLAAGPVSASDNNTQERPGYSFFGIGANIVDYEENTALRIEGGTVDVETDSIVNITQQSGTFVSFSSDLGFYLTTSSTLGNTNVDESWLIGETSIRTNKVSFEQQRLSFIFSRHFKSEYYLLFGARYDNTEFKRFGHQLTSDAAQFGLSETSFEPGTESETVRELSAIAGIERSNLFLSGEPGWRYKAQLILGIPVFSSISNTEIKDGETFSDSFGGIVAQLRVTHGYQFNPNLFFGVNLDLWISRRNSISRDVEDDSGINRFPENTLISLFPSLALYWSF